MRFSETEKEKGTERMKTIMKKMFILIMALVMAMSAFTGAAFGGILDELQKSPNAMVLVTADNEDCKELANFGDLKVHIRSEGSNLDVTVPVQKVEDEGEFYGMWVGVPEKKIEDEVMKELAEIQGKFDLGELEGEDALDDIEAALTRFKVDVEGLPEGHYTSEGGAVVITSEMIKQALDILREMLEEEYGEFDTFGGLIERILAEEDLTLDDLFDTTGITPEEMEEMGITQADIDAMKDLILNIDTVLEYMSSEEFTGVLIGIVGLTCDCPYMESFWITHRYYERVNGRLKLVGTADEGEYDEFWEDYSLTGQSGDIIRASDYLKPEYKGVTYTFEGSYDDFVLLDSDYSWKEAKMDSFVLGDEEVSGLVLRYVIDRGGAAGGGSGNSGDHASKAGASGDKSPATGDEQMPGMYILLFLTAVMAAGAAAAAKRREK